MTITKKPTLRRSQTITTFGVGSIVDLPESSVMVCGIDKWDTRGATRLSDPRLERKLGAPYFVMPPDTDQSKEGIRVVRFPRWMRCRACGSLRDLSTWRTRAEKTFPDQDFYRRPFCDVCSVPLIPSRFVVACRKGHISDFPYIEWVHSNSNKECLCPDLKYSESGRSTSLAGIIISCKSCKSSRSLRNAFSKQILSSVTMCKGDKPWELKWEEGCGEQLTGLLRGGTNVHYPIVKSSILIPPFTSENLKTRIANTRMWQIYESQDGGMDINTVATMIATDTDETKEKILEAMDEMEKGDTVQESERTEEQYRFDEFKAFNGQVLSQEDFQITPVDGSVYGIPYLDKVVLVKRLREIRVQTGFARIRPPDFGENLEESGPSEIIEEVAVTDDRKIKWRPGFEVRGEGIFLNFDASGISEWASQKYVKGRSRLLVERFTKRKDIFATVDKMTTEYILLHTISHLLIRQLSFECGYGSSALRERIYCSSDQNTNPMAGILIYTADGDSEGTMGGLVRQGRVDYFPKTLFNATMVAKWCSSDPLCIESEGQGFQSTNLAACHACAMLPETSCEIMNRYLDRGLVVGTLENPGIGLLSKWVDDMTKIAKE